MTVHDNITATVIMSDIWAFKIFKMCVIGTEVAQGHPCGGAENAGVGNA